MMKYLLILNKFELNKEKLKDKIRSKIQAKFYEDNGLILETSHNIDEVLYFEEIEKILLMHKDWQKFSFTNFKENFNVNIRHYLIKTKFLDKIPISSKSLIKKINSVLKAHDEKNPENIIYIEFIKRDRIPYYRVFITPIKY